MSTFYIQSLCRIVCVFFILISVVWIRSGSVAQGYHGNYQSIAELNRILTLSSPPGSRGHEYENADKYDDPLDLDRIYNLKYPNGSSTGRSKVEVLGETLKEQIHKLRHAPGGRCDLVFLIDSSTSVGEQHFWYEVRFVEKLLVDFTVDRNSTRVSVIRFSSESRVERYIDHMSKPSDDNHKCYLMEEQLPQIEYKYGGTYTLAAILEAQRVLKYKRPDAQQAVFLVTDGYSNGGDPLPATAQLRSENVEFFTFGIRGGNPEELWDMSSEPKAKHMYILDSFAEFEALARRALHEDLPIGRYIPQRSNKCQHLCTEGQDCCDKKAECTCGTHTGKYECSCLPGYYGGGLRGGCFRCGAGTYKNQTEPGDESICLSCPDHNEVSTPGSTSIENCHCKLGFRRSGPHKCTEMTCPKLRRPDDGYFVHSMCDNVYNAACGIRCNAGYTLRGSSIRLCQKDGTWSGNDSACEIKKCEILTAPPNGKMECTKEDSSFETKCVSTCNAGYKLVGSKTRECLGMGFWTGITATCREVECSRLPDLVDGFIQPVSCTSGPSRYGTVCRFMCRQGYKLDGAHSRQCTSAGVWNPKEDRDIVCVDIAPPVLEGCPRDMVAETEPDDYVAKVTWDPPIAIDNSGFLPMVTPVPAVVPPVSIPIGTTHIKYIAEDGSRNKVHCSFSVYVKDTQPPRVDRCISPPPFVLRNNDVTVKWEEPEFSDNSRRPVTTKQSHKPGKFPLGKTRVVYTAFDKAGNNNTCVVEIVVKEHACANPPRPVNGDIVCDELPDDVVCRLSCNHGYNFAMEPAEEYHCDYDFGHWQPEKYFPFPDCSTSKLSNHVVQGGKIEVKTESSCDNKLILNKIESNYWRKIEYKVKEYCPPNDICEVEPHQLVCLDDNEISNEIDTFDNSIGQLPLGGRQRRSVIDNSIGVVPAPATPSSTSIEGNNWRTLTVDFDISGRLSGKGDLITHPEQKTLKNDVITVMNKLRVDADFGHLDETQLKEYRVQVVEILLRDPEPKIVCAEGDIRRGDSCVTCALGTFYNVVSGDCKVCPLGTYQPSEGANTCLVCPDHTSTTSNNSKSITQCKGQCLPGSFASDGLEPCETCAIGSYQPEYTSRSCIKCPVGTTTWGRGSRQQDKCGEMCPAGYISRDGLMPCFPCPRGHFQSDPGKSSCFRCPGSVNTKRDAATDITECEGITLHQVVDYDLIPTSQLTINECFKSPCYNNATCESMEVGFQCHCRPGWSGVHCEVDIDECASNPCHNNASCNDLMDAFQCDCPEGYEGLICEINTDECSPNLCRHNATCVDGVNQYRCDCLEGYDGMNCEVNEDDCRGSPCTNGGTCIDHVAAYTCNCVAGYQGDNCDVNIDECDSSPCLNNATCLDLVNSYRCECTPGYTGQHCDTEIDECSSAPCHEGATCQDLVARYHCLCPPSYAGEHCDKKLNSTFDLYFTKNAGLTDYVALDGSIPDLTEMTISFWMKANYTGNYGTPLSYATDTEANAMTITDFDGIVLNIDGEKVIADIKVSDGRWHHMGFVWSSDEGRWAIYMDGTLEETGLNLARGKTIEGGGVLVLGQEQDARGGEFNSKESFVGHLSRLNIWNYKLSAERISGLMSTCEEYIGSVLAWPDVLAGVHGTVERHDSQLCRECQVPTNVTTGFVTWNGTKTGDVASYACEHGHRVMGDALRKCGVNSTWDGSEPVCERVKCLTRPYVANSRIVSFANTYGNLMEFSCNTGYAMIGNKSLYCNAEGTWDGQVPQCKEIFCPKIPHTPNILTIPRRRFGNAKPSDVTYFSCATGFTLDGETSLRCEESGNWSGSFPECNVTVCGVAPNITNGLPSEPSRVFQYNQAAEYKCLPGYHIKRSSRRTLSCLSSGHWSVYKPRCLKVTCPELKTIRNGIQEGTDFTYSEVVRYRCHSGFVLSANGVLECGESGQWNGTVPDCIPTDCPQLEPVEHGSIQISNHESNSSALYSCDVGYILIGPFMRRCLPNKTWDSAPPICNLIRCKPPEPVKYGTVLGDELYYGNYANYTCDHGFVLIGRPDVRCGSNGTWINPAPICAPLECPKVELKHGNIIGNSFLVNDTVEFVCDTGHDINGSSQIICQPDGTWSSAFPSCDPIKCTEPVPIDGGTFSVTSLEPGSVVKYTCMVGYDINGKDTRTCRSDGTWTGPTPKCNSLRCLYPKQIQHGQFIAHDNTYGSDIEYMCDQGYELLGPENRTCTGNKDWSGSSPECKIMTCPSPPDIAYGRHIGVNYTVGASIKYKCEPGFQLDSDVDRYCSENSTWNGPEPKCLPIQCDEPSSAILGGRLLGTNFSYSAVVRYVCHAGYYTTDVTKRSCQSDGTWMNPAPTCLKVKCPAPTRIAHGIINGTDHHFNERVFYACVSGYELLGQDSIICLANRSWSGKPPACVPVTCPYLFDPNNGKVKLSGLEYSDVVRYECDLRYKMVGDDTRTCGEDGTWSGSQPSCVAVKCPPPPSLPHGEIMFNNLRAGDVVQYLCSTGFILVQPIEMQCTEHGNYTGDIPECVRVQCKPPLKIRHGYFIKNGTSYGDYAQYQCLKGYKVLGRGDGKMICDSRGQWKGNPLTCSPVDCPILPSIKNGWYTKYIKYEYGANITYHCDIGYHVVGDEYVVCEEDGKWSSEGPICELERCPEPNIQSSVVSVISAMYDTPTDRDTFDYPYGVTIKISCVPGYELKGVSELRCLSTGRWSFTTPQCVPVTCPEPDIINGIIEAPQGYVYNQSINLSCMEGYLLEGESDLVCLEDSNWSNKEPQCVIATCDTPYLDNGEFSILKSPNKGYGYPHGIVLQFSCDTGYVLEGSETLTCESTARWSDDNPVCRHVPCESPVIGTDHAPIMSPVKSQYSHTDMITFSCERGFNLSHEDNIYCTDAGEWNGTLPTCVLIECPYIRIRDSHLHRTINDVQIIPTSSSRFVQGIKITVECDVGYELVGSDELTCQENGTWNAKIPVCMPVYCSVPVVSHGYVRQPRGDTPGYAVQSTATVYCNRGYTISDNYQIECLPNGTWSVQSITCNTITCDVPEVDAATVVSKRRNGISYFTVDDEIKIICLTGYVLIGETDRFICTDEGTWDKKIPHCQKLECSAPNIENSRIILNEKTSDRSTKFEYGDVVQVECDEGYKLKGVSELRCNSTTKWSQQLPLCQLIRCPALFVEHGLVVADDNTYGSSITIECEIGYELYGDDQLTCKGEGDWSGDQPICAMIECTKPDIKHGKIIGYSNTTYNFGAIISFQCDEGYRLQGEESTLCMPDSSWFDRPPTCQLVLCKQPPTEVEFGSIEVIKLDTDDLFSFGSLLNYSCNLGYRVEGPGEIKCESNGQWSADFSTCVRNHCPTPNTDNGYVDGRSRGDKGTYIFGDTVRFQCRAGFELSGAPEMFCDPDGIWTHEFPTCSRVECPKPTPITNGTMQGESFKFGDKIIYACQEGFELVGSPEVTCLAEKAWSKLPSCDMIICQLPPQIKHGMYLITGLRYSDKIRYACNSGYELAGEAEHTCQDNRSWSGQIPSCVPIKCVDPIPPLLNGKPILHEQIMKDIVYVYLDKVHYVCLDGHTMVGSTSIQCTASGKWTALSAKCVVVACDKPTAIDNGRFIGGTYVFGSMIEYRCNEGYELAGNDQLWCTAMGKWNSTTPRCDAVSCHFPTIPHYGVLGSGSVKVEKQKDFVQLVPLGFHFSDHVDYSCQTGYRLSGQNKIQCLANGTWSARSPECNRVNCVAIPHIRNGVVNGTGGFYKDRLTVTCNVGFELRGDNYIECDANQDWIVHRVECSLIVCAVPPIIEHGHAMGGPYLFNRTIQYKCKDGYELVDGDENRTCLASHVWSGRTPSCSAVMCQSPQPILNGYYIVDAGVSLHFRVMINFGCDPGFELHGKTSAKCLANRTWSEHVPRCKPIRCSDPDPIPNGKIVGNLIHEYNDMIQYSCDVGYKIDGEAFRTCIANGTWSGVAPVCEMVTCSPPSQLSHGTVRGTHHTFGSVILHSCDDMYELRGPQRRLCEADGDWSGDEPWCKLKSCSRPPQLNHGTINIVGTNYSAGTNITYTCQVGYQLSGISVLTCLGDDWSDAFPHCMEVSCGEPAVVEHTTVKGDDYHFGEQVLYRCLEGYNAVGKATITCQASGTWSEIRIKCSPVSCGEPPTISNSFTKKEGTNFGDLVVYGCNAGYETFGNNVLECLADGTWDGSLPTCKMVSCGDVPVISHASVIVSRKTYTSVAMYTCNNGYILRGSAKVSCMANATWMYDNKPSCVPVDCGHPPPLLNGGVKVPDTRLGNTASYYCLEGYTLEGNTTARCNYDGTWNAPAPTCQPVTCPPPDAPQNGRVQGDLHEFGSDVLYSCESGFKLIGDLVRTCMPDRTWGGKEPRCDLIYCGPLESPEHGNITFSDHRHHGSVAEFVCEPGYELVGNSSLMCTGDGDWNDTTPTCLSHVVECPSPVLPPDVLGIEGEFVVGDTIILQCVEGLHAVDTMAIICQEDLQWTTPLGTCQPVSCGPPPERPWVVLLGRSFNYGDKVVYMCRQGLTPASLPVLTCGSDGKWDKTPQCLATCAFGCENGGTCVGRNLCKCASGFAGRFCEQAICVLPCLHGGVCTGPYRCTCPYGFSGARCEKPVCSTPCENGGVCVAPNRCYCPHGFRPPFCIR